MSEQDTASTRRGRRSTSEDEVLLDRELADLPPDLRWREWMLCVEAVIVVAVEPVGREMLVGRNHGRATHPRDEASGRMWC